jgi:hypothetical protein
MTKTHVVNGTITDPKTITLDESLPEGDGRVRVWVEILPKGPKPTMAEAIAEIRARQQARGHVPPTTAEIEAHFVDQPLDDGDPE